MRVRPFVELLEERNLLCGPEDCEESELVLSNSPAEQSLPVLRTAAITATVPVPDAQYKVNHPPRLQIGDAELAGFPGGETDQVEVLWETIPAGTGTDDKFKVQYRQLGQASWLDAGQIRRINTGVEGRVIHSALIEGLAYDQSYEYRVRHLRANTPIATYQAPFRTRLAVNDPTPFTFVAYGDSANITSISGFRSVQNRINQTDPRFAVLLGDNIYTDGSHPQSDTRFDPAISPEAVKWVASHIDYPAIGNHEINLGSLGKPYEEQFSVPVPIQGVTSPAQPPASERAEHNYSFDFGNVHFVTFDTNSLHNAKRLDGLLTWVEKDLQASQAQWKIVFAHHPVGGAPDKPESPSDNYYKQVVPRLRKAGVDLFLVGHSHTYSRTYPLLGEVNDQATFVLDTDGDYAKGSGLVQVVAGVGGTDLRKGDYSQFPFVAHGFSSSTVPKSKKGFAQVSVTPSQLRVSYVVAADGQVLDSFTISDSQPDTVSLQDGLEGYQGTRDTRLRGDFPDLNTGASTKLGLDGSPDQVSLIRWDTSGIPSDTVLTSATLSINVTNPSVDDFEVYEALKPWGESTANYQLAATDSPWEIAGAAGPSDRASEVLAAVTSPTTGLATFQLNAKGLAVVQKWIADPTRNHGIVIQDLKNESSDALDFYGSEAIGLGPKLTLTFQTRPSIPVNHPPIAHPQSFTMDEDTSHSVILSGSDSDGDPLNFTIESMPAKGTLTGTAPDFVYKPNANFHGLDTFRFRVSDGSATSEVATVSIAVSAVNDAPKSVPLSFTTTTNKSLEITLKGTDVDGDLLSYSINSGPASGTLKGTAPALTYIPNPGFVGADTFTYRVHDSTSSSSVANVWVDVVGASPIAVSFQNGAFPSASYTGGRDTTVLGAQPSTNWGTAKHLEIDGNPDAAALLKWDLTGIPAGNSVQSASITLHVTNPTSHAFNIYQMLRPWVETTATFESFDTGKLWQTAGARGSQDRNNVVLGTLKAPTAGPVKISLNSTGIAVIQGWVNNPSQNHGLIIQNYSNTSNDKLEITSGNGNLASTRPKLTIVYSPGSAPTPAAQKIAAVTYRTPTLTNADNAFDVNADLVVSARDALIIINHLNGSGGLIIDDTPANAEASDFYPDVSGDQRISPMDALLVINALNEPLQPAAEGEDSTLDEETLLPNSAIRLLTVKGAHNCDDDSLVRTRIGRRPVR